MTDPRVEFTFAGIVCKRLDYANRQPVLGLVELEDLFSMIVGVLLFPLEDFLDGWVFDDRHTLVVVEKPFDYIRYRINIDLAILMSSKNWFVLSFESVHILGLGENLRLPLCLS